jgi:hypothetical protein
MGRRQQSTNAHVDGHPDVGQLVVVLRVDRRFPYARVR